MTTPQQHHDQFALHLQQVGVLGLYQSHNFGLNLDLIINTLNAASTAGILLGEEPFNRLQINVLRLQSDLAQISNCLHQERVRYHRYRNSLKGECIRKNNISEILAKARGILPPRLTVQQQYSSIAAEYTQRPNIFRPIPIVTPTSPLFVNPIANLQTLPNPVRAVLP